MTLTSSLFKRTFDFLLSFVVVVALFPIIIICWVAASIDTKSNGFFVQTRVGRNGELFRVFKIKTMTNKNIDSRSTISTADMNEITRTGKLFRQYKLDELPQLFNVLLGDMSFVGPRPDVPGYADMLIGADRVLLSLRPGITGPASIKYKNEEFLLAQQENPKSYNDEIIWPDKVKINIEYFHNYSFMQDIRYILKTIKS